MHSTCKICPQLFDNNCSALPVTIFSQFLKWIFSKDFNLKMHAAAVYFFLLGFVLAFASAATNQKSENHANKHNLMASPTNLEGSEYKTSTNGDAVHVQTSASDFTELVKENVAIVDKTAFIGLALTGNRFKLITRPRRFGKTTNLSMLEAFLRKDSLVTSQNLFANYNITKEPAFEHVRRNHQNQYAVFHFSFLSFASKRTGSKFESAFLLYIQTVLFGYVGKYNTTIDSREKLWIERLCFQQKIDSLTPLLMGYKTLIESLRTKGYKIAVLVDEYDAPILNIIDQGTRTLEAGKDLTNSELYLVTLELMREFYLFFFKDGIKPSPDKGILVGISYLAKTSLFSDLSNFEEFTIFNDQTFNSLFGFTKIEVDDLIIKSKTQLKYKDFDEWYDGYKFGDASLFNPFSVLSAIKRNKFETFWGQTGSIKVFKSLICYSGRIGILHIHLLLSGHALEKTIEKDLVIEDLFKKEETYWSLLAQAGYLNAVKTKKDDVFELRIPNKEVKDYIKKAFAPELRKEQEEYDKFLETFKGLQNGNESNQNGSKSIQEYLNIHYNSPSPYFHLDLNESMERFGKDLETLLTGVPKDKMVSDIFTENRQEIYEALVITNDTIIIIDLVKVDAITNDTAPEQHLPTFKNHSTVLEKLKASKYYKIGIWIWKGIEKIAVEVMVDLIKSHM
ncbi:unnamed protein product [Bemisia tabaci]|uniref:AAA-ATPase-like domain-containing protein n=2 Tax=Bemisia tabaci TaxID=7038 RepID=A0A9P0C766_BEMTA|nr:unnamed protein product [Bemisia tabaci]